MLFLLRGGEGGVLSARRGGGGSSFLLKMPGAGGGGSPRRGRGKRVSVGNFGGVFFFLFRGRNFHQVNDLPILRVAVLSYPVGGQLFPISLRARILKKINLA